MKDQTLANITEELVGTGKFLSEFTGDKLECVRKFSECHKIVEWIKKTTKGTVYIEASMHTGTC